MKTPVDSVNVYVHGRSALTLGEDKKIEKFRVEHRVNSDFRAAAKEFSGAKKNRVEHRENQQNQNKIFPRLEAAEQKKVIHKINQSSDFQWSEKTCLIT
ncbi:hypothetical protein P4C99_21415 [Pontiellaceae bacterium B1224]|nr:hypothetical protein [Pontiellaceae bacterium B1224]